MVVKNLNWSFHTKTSQLAAPQFQVSNFFPIKFYDQILYGFPNGGNENKTNRKIAHKMKKKFNQIRKISIFFHIEKIQINTRIKHTQHVNIA